MRRLSIIDLEGGSQPIWNEDQTIGVICNGEIYNYIELAGELRSKGHAFRTRCDTEVLVHLYEEFGEAMTSRLRGMFAFCIFDRRTHVLFIARDHFGQKPLYYTEGEGCFAFASELKALLTLPWVNRELDSEAFLDFAVWMSLPAPRTHFRHIRKLQAGCSLTISLASVKVTSGQYWNYDLQTEPDLDEIDIAVEELDCALNESISLHLRADVPVGLLLSSGLDSRTILAYAQPFQSGRLETFSVGFGTEDSELPEAAKAAKASGSRHHELVLGVSDFSKSFDRVVNFLDEPIGDPACFAVLRLCELARSHVKVLLSGEGSDEIFGGYEDRYSGMIATMERTNRFRLFSKVLPSAGVHASTSRWERFLARAHSSRGSETVMLRAEGLPGDVRVPRVLDLAQLRTLPRRATSLSQSTFQPRRDTLSSLLAFDLGWQLAESLLQKADKMSMGASIELRTPFLDLEVAKVAARIPSSLKLPSGGPGKYVLRKTLAKKMGGLRDPPKMGFPVPLHSWFVGPLRMQIEDELFGVSSIVGGYLDRALLRAAWNDLLAGWDGSRIFFSLWAYERWNRLVVRGGV
jgi:asparagine synthase (glutamine-hydrolysing)